MFIKAILFDFIGTVVMEKDPSTVNRCFAMAFKDHGIEITDELIKVNRGKDKRDMIMAVLKNAGHSLELHDSIMNSLKEHLENNLTNFSENTGAKEIIEYAKKKGMVVGLGTGLPRDTFESILHHLQWGDPAFDYIGIAAETGRGRPYPDMILDMLKKCDLKNTELLKVGDTVSDIQEGKNANIMTVAILSGTQDEQEIMNQKPDHAIRHLSELKEIIY
jgi:phosphonoacetaldehyde hydrolase